STRSALESIHAENTARLVPADLRAIKLGLAPAQHPIPEAQEKNFRMGGLKKLLRLKLRLDHLIDPAPAPLPHEDQEFRRKSLKRRLAPLSTRDEIVRQLPRIRTLQVLRPQDEECRARIASEILADSFLEIGSGLHQIDRHGQSERLQLLQINDVLEALRKLRDHRSDGLGDF